MNIQNEHEEAKRNIKDEQVLIIENCSNPTVAADKVCEYDTKTACALIDSLNPFSAAFALHVLSKRAQYGNSGI